ncbi:hypothetical protein ACFXK0_28985 [Nocardia sp. NPDC059177]|uniref:hypothetical protein n=1 Tax=Nocardia sp. NPDC059177 TaxID=3346759 RepID=UPI00367FB7F3
MPGLLHDEVVEAVESATRKSFELLAAHKYLLRRELTTLPDNPDLVALCEHYDILDKIVLHDDLESGIRLRLHIFGHGYHDRPHNHRWTYASHIRNLSSRSGPVGVIRLLPHAPRYQIRVC